MGGVLRAIGRFVVYLFRAPARVIWRDLLRPIAFSFGGKGWELFIVVFFAVGMAAATMLIRKRARIASRVSDATLIERTQSAGELDAAADAAEMSGRLDEAVRLRFRAGFTRLASLGAIPDRDVTTTQQARQRLRQETFDRIATRHEEIAFAGAIASLDDVAVARQGWPEVIRVAANKIAASKAAE